MILLKKCLHRSFSSIARFFNREMEKSILKERFHGLPRLSVLLGPPSTGKTALVRHVLQENDLNGNPKYHALFANLRGVSTSSKTLSCQRWQPHLLEVLLTTRLQTSFGSLFLKFESIPATALLRSISQV